MADFYHDFSMGFLEVNGGMALRKGMANLCTPMVRKTQQPIEWISFFLFCESYFSSTDFDLF